MPDAGGMIIASDQTTARAYAGLLTKITGEAPTVVLSDDPGSSDRISQFSAGTSRWLVAVRMVSEGWMSPTGGRCLRHQRLDPAVLRSGRGSVRPIAAPRREQPASSCRRCRRCYSWPANWRPSATTSWVSRTANPSTTSCSSSADAPNRPRPTAGSSPWGRRRTGPGHLRRRIIRHRNPAGSEEEADYLGIPGLLDAEQMRDLLRRRQEEQLATRSAAGVDATPRTPHGQLRELRRELNALVAATHHRTGRSHGWIHNELRRLCGGPPVAAANREQLKPESKLFGTLRI